MAGVEHWAGYNCAVFWPFRRASWEVHSETPVWRQADHSCAQLPFLVAMMLLAKVVHKKGRRLETPSLDLTACNIKERVASQIDTFSAGVLADV